jgi:hypothetical protein
MGNCPSGFLRAGSCPARRTIGTLQRIVNWQAAETEEGIGSGQVPFLLAERARLECARSMRAVKGNLATPLIRDIGSEVPTSTTAV